VSLGDRLLKLVGLDFDFAADVGRAPWNEVAGQLYVGARPRVEDTEPLREVGITHVVSCLPEARRADCRFLAASFEWLFVPARDEVSQDLAGSFPAVFRFAEQARKSSRAARLLIHCEAGVSRSAALAIALVMKTQRRSFLDAFLHVRHRRPEILPNIGFASQLQHLEYELLGRVHRAGEVSSLARYLRQACNAPVETTLLQDALERNDYDAPRAIRSIFGDDIPRVIQGVRS